MSETKTNLNIKEKNSIEEQRLERNFNRGINEIKIKMYVDFLFCFRHPLEDSATMGDDEKQAEIDRKKAEVRARLEAQAAGKKAKKGFMTPERKKKLRVRSYY